MHLARHFLFPLVDASPAALGHFHLPSGPFCSGGDSFATAGMPVPEAFDVPQQANLFYDSVELSPDV